MRSLRIARRRQRIRELAAPIHRLAWYSTQAERRLEAADNWAHQATMRILPGDPETDHWVHSAIIEAQRFEASAGLALIKADQAMRRLRAARKRLIQRHRPAERWRWV